MREEAECSNDMREPENASGLCATEWHTGLLSSVIRVKHQELCEIQQQMISVPRTGRYCLRRRAASVEGQIAQMRAALQPHQRRSKSVSSCSGGSRRSAMWAVKASDWDPSEAEFKHLVDNYCDPARAEKITAFKYAIDQRRALLSTLLQRKACIDCGTGDPSRVKIARTKGGKPYGVLKADPFAPNFNFNASHDGKYVTLCAHPQFLCGIDVVEVSDNPRLWEGLVPTMSPQALAYFAKIDPRLQAGYTQVMFACKEAYTKAVGVGMFEEFSGINFNPQIPESWARPCNEARHGHFTVTTTKLQRGRVVEQKGEWHLEVTWPAGDLSLIHI
eukprot:TRINITY_DN7371_c0_g1_i6.p1 TRINITY_DN7371_c0_g1~~TRINITY_DN7371_c0_g1_i6.p1  ORF type:complete len:332 (+),score=40.78 TRINITY_DN7371_c0_g1_i6:19-1014(+)